MLLAVVLGIVTMHALAVGFIAATTTIATPCRRGHRLCPDDRACCKHRTITTGARRPVLGALINEYERAA